MKLTFNVASGIDIAKLNNKINYWKDNNPPMETPILLANFETVSALGVDDHLNTEFIKLQNSKDIRLYRGCKVFVDESKNFGDIELR